MKITKLSWAGIMLESSGSTLYIDPLQNVDMIAPFVGKPKFPIFDVSRSKNGSANVLITHIHQDHFDRPLLPELLGKKGKLWGPEPVCQTADSDGLKSSIAKLYDTFSVGNFQITAVPAVDWVGDEQVSYVISDGLHTVYHGGDTNWHGYWWPVAKRFGPFSAVFLPVNGVTGALPGQEIISDMQGTMNPAQAVTAARILGAEFLVPIHYAQFDNPPAYRQFPDLENSLDQSGIQQNVAIRRLEDGEIIVC